MVAETSDRRIPDWLDRHTEDWVAEGLISGEQAGAIRRFEHAPTVDDRRLTVVAEVAIYLGSLIAFTGGAAIIGPNWDALGFVGQLALGAAIAVVGFVAGTWMVGLGESGTVRLGSFLWMVGTAGVALMVAVAMHEVEPADDGWVVLAVGVPVLAIGAVLWRNLDRPLQLVTTVVGVVLVGVGVGQLLEPSVWLVSPIVWGAGLVVGAVATVGRLQPRLVVLAVAGVAMMSATFALGEESERVAAVTAVLTAAGIVAFALVDRSWPLVGLGLFAFFMAITMAMQTVLEGMAARLVAVLAGLLMVAVVALRAQRRGSAPGVDELS